MLQHGAYTMLMDSCYDREIFPTLEEAIDWCWASTAEEVEAVKFVLSKFFIEEDGIYKQRHISEKINKYHENAATNKAIALEREKKKREKKVLNNEDSTNREQSVNDSSTNEHLIKNYKLRTTNQELRTKNNELKTINQSSKDKPIVPQATHSAEINEVFEFWKTTLNHPRSNLDDKRKALIRKRLKSGYSTEDLKTAIFGCSNTPHNMGDNDRGQKYDSIELILRDSGQIDRFMNNGTSPPTTRSKSLNSNVAAAKAFLEDSK